MTTPTKKQNAWLAADAASVGLDHALQAVDEARAVLAIKGLLDVTAAHLLFETRENLHRRKERVDGYLAKMDKPT